jgi:HlyD family secretion protein
VDIARRTSTNLGKKAMAAAVAAALLVGLAGTLWRTTAAAAPTVARSTVWTERVHRGDLVRQVPVHGTLVPDHVQWLSAVSAARVARIAVRPGATVEPDTVLMTLDNAELELAALEAERQAASAGSALIQVDVRTHAEQKVAESGLAGMRAELRDAERHAQSADRLAPEGLMSPLDHADAQNKAAGLTDRVGTEAARTQILETGRERQLTAQRVEVERLREIARFRHRQLDALQVRAGIHGVVQDIPLENGQWVAIGTVLAKVAEPNRLKAEVRVAEGNARDLHKGLPVRFEAVAGEFRGHIERVDPAVVAGSVRLEVTLDDATPSGARADQSVNGYVEIEKLDNVLFVARPAGAQDGATMGLFRVEPDGVHASRVTARLGRGSAREIEITGGLLEGNEVVVSDTSTWEASNRIKLN